MKISFPKRKTNLIIFFLLVGLILAYLPYVNIYSANFMDVYYLLLIFFLVSPFSAKFFLIMSFITFILIIGISLAKFNIFYVEELGVAVYFFLWLSLVLKITDFLKEIKK